MSNQVIIVNNNSGVRLVKKWPAFFLCLFFGYLGVHRFYEGRIILGIVYMLTGGLFGLRWVFDTIRILFKPNPYVAG